MNKGGNLYGYDRRGSNSCGFKRRIEKPSGKSDADRNKGAAIGGLPFPLSHLALVGMQNQTAIQKMVQNQYFSNIEAAVCAQRNMDQMGDTNGNE